MVLLLFGLLMTLRLVPWRPRWHVGVGVGAAVAVVRHGGGGHGGRRWC